MTADSLDNDRRRGFCRWSVRRRRHHIGDRLRRVLAAPYTIHDHDLRSDVGIGIVMAGRTDDAHELVRKGSIALYEAKQTAQGSTVTPFQNAIYPLIFCAASLGLG